MSDPSGKEAQHTPGPWRVSALDSRSVVNAPAHPETTPTKTIARVLPRLEPEQSANARLIATTPNLLAALEGLLEWYAGLPEPGLVPYGAELSARLREAREAIAAAKGGAS